MRTLLPPPDLNLAELFRSDQLFATFAAALQPSLHEDFECYAAAGIAMDVHERFEGIAGLRQLWLNWTGPWASYRSEVLDLIELDDGVFAVVRDYGRREGMTAEVELVGATIWTLEQGKIKGAVFYTDRDEAQRAAGLSE